MEKQPGRIVIFVGQSGSGKTTQIKKLLSEPGFRILPSITTRPQRPNDLENEYRYTSPEEHQALARAGRFLWNVVAGNQNFYAKDQADVQAALADHGTTYVNALIPSCAAILADEYGPERIRTFLLPNPGDHVLIQRMIARGDSATGAAERLKNETEENWTAQAGIIPCLQVIQSQTIEDRHAEIMHSIQDW